MKQLFFIFLTVIAGLTISCSNTKKAAADGNAGLKICLSMELLEMPVDSIRMDPINIDSMRLNGDCLDIFVSYGGGCGDVKFNMYYTNIVQNSYPPQTAIYLAFEDNDHCRAIETKKITFDLKPFAEYASNGGVWLNLANEKSARILYKTEQ